MKLLLDTTVLIDILRSRRDRRTLFADLVAHGHTLCLSAMNVAEVYGGMRPSEKVRTDALIESFHCFPTTIEIARSAGSLKSRFARQGITLDLPDMIVAATALEHGLTLMTDNRKDFPLPELQMYDLP